jgi:hypothetical protein
LRLSYLRGSDWQQHNAEKAEAENKKPFAISHLPFAICHLKQANRQNDKWQMANDKWQILISSSKTQVLVSVLR